MMRFEPYWETLGVLVLATFGVLFGRLASRAGKFLWLLAYIVPLVVLVAIAIPRWMPELEFVAPFCWIMADRREFALLAFICTAMLTIPMPGLPHKSQKITVCSFMVVFVTVYSVLPFLLPGFNYSYLRTLRTTMDRDGVCMQSNGYNCGPAAAVTALRRLGLAAEEGELAILAHTTCIAGTPADSLCAAIQRRYGNDGIECRYRRFASVADMRGVEPVIATVKFGFLVDHYITVLAVSETTVVVGDPLEGLQTLTHQQFVEKWRKCGITVKRALPAKGAPNPGPRHL